MKKELQRAARIFSTEIRLASSAMAILRRNVLIISFLTLVLLASKGITEARLSLSSLPSLRGGYIALAPATKPVQKNSPRPALFGVANLQRSISHIGSKQWSGLGREWGRMATSIGRLFTREESVDSGNLDVVLRTFKSVLNGSDLDTAQLLKACRAHLALMRSGGAAMRVVAKDMEGNLIKAETLFKKLPKEGKHLASLLETERDSGVHDGPNMLTNESAATGLLWIRRSLAFQLDLYASLIANDQHPKDAAMDAYYKTLSPYHGWMLQKAFPLSLSAMPDRKVFIAKFGGQDPDDLDEDHERDVVKKLKALVATWEPIIDTWRYEFERLDLEDTRRV